VPRFEGWLLAKAFRETGGTSLSIFQGLLYQTAGCHFMNDGVHGDMKGLETGEHFTDHRNESQRKSEITYTQ